MFVALVMALKKELVVGCASRVCRAIRSPRCCRLSRRDYLLYSIYDRGQLGIFILGQTRMVMDHLRLSVKSPHGSAYAYITHHVASQTPEAHRPDGRAGRASG